MKTDNTKYIERGNKHNLIKPQLLKVFSNVQQIYIHASKSYSPEFKEDQLIWPFSVFSLLDIVGDTKVNIIEISVDKHKDLNLYPWLGELESSTAFPSIIKKCDEMKFELKFKIRDNFTKNHTLKLSISRKCDK